MAGHPRSGAAEQIFGYGVNQAREGESIFLFLIGDRRRREDPLLLSPLQPH